MPTKLTRDDAARIAALAKLDMSDAELERAARDLASILDHFASLGAVDTDAIQPAAPGAEAHVRPDEPRPSLDAAGTFANAPDADRAAGVFRVPRVLGS